MVEIKQGFRSFFFRNAPGEDEDDRQVADHGPIFASRNVRVMATE